MAFTVETGANVAGANSYVSVTYADNYFAMDVNMAATWEALDDEVKEQHLQMATRILNQKVRWKGEKFAATSPLPWPRTGVYDRDNILVDDDEIPEQLKECVCEMAKYVLAGEDPTVGNGADYIKKIVADVVEIEYQDGSGQTSLPAMFHNLLRGIGTYPSALGFSFARIIKA